MINAPDAQMLEQFARDQSEAAFAELVKRYIGLVYSVAFRKAGNPQHAEDITQAVFIILARKAGSLGAKTVLPGWLYNTARLTAANFQRSEMRRARREQEAFMQSTIEEPALDALWREMSPLLEDAMAGMGAIDRDAIVLRFIQNLSLADVGMALGITERAAQKRVNRALEKMRRFFFKRGVASTTAIIAGAISSNSVQAAPQALAQSVTAAAIAQGATASGSTLSLVKGALKVMAWTKTKTLVTAAAILLFATGTATITVKEIQVHRTYPWQTRVPKYELLMPPLGKSPSTIPPQVRILPARYPGSPGGYASGGGGLLGLNQSALEVVRHSFGDDPHNIYSTNLSAELPRGSYDFIANLPNGESEDFNALQRKLKEDWGVVGKTETIHEDVMMLDIKPFSAPNLKLSTGSQYMYMVWRNSASRLECKHAALPDFANLMALSAQFPIVDRTGLSNFYDFDLNCNYTSVTGRDWNQINLALGSLGLELAPTNIPIEMRVIEKMK